VSETEEGPRKDKKKKKEKNQENRLNQIMKMAVLIVKPAKTGRLLHQEIPQTEMLENSHALA
jgi:hypothetical protein